MSGVPGWYVSSILLTRKMADEVNATKVATRKAPKFGAADGLRDDGVFIFTTSPSYFLIAHAMVSFCLPPPSPSQILFISYVLNDQVVYDVTFLQNRTLIKQRGDRGD